MNPKTKKPLSGVSAKQTKQENLKNGLQSLGGIFTVDNGWENSAQEKKNFVIPKIKKPSIASNEPRNTPSKSGVTALQVPKFNVLHQQTNRQVKSNINFIPEQADSHTSNKFNFRRNESESEDDEIDFVLSTSAKRKSMFSDSEDEETPQDTDDRVEEDRNDNPAKRQRMSPLSEDVDNQDESADKAELVKYGDGDDDDDALDLIYNDDE